MKDSKSTSFSETFEKEKISSITYTSVMVASLVLVIGNFYLHDIPQIYGNQLMNIFDTSTVEISYLYSAYALPNFFCIYVGAYMINKAGLHFSTVVFSALIFAGITISYFGLYFEKFWIVVSGFVAFGCGAENLVVAQTAICEKWFTGKYLSFAMSCTFASCCLGGLGQAYFGPLLYQKTESLYEPFFLSILVTFVSCLAAFWYFMIDLKHGHKLEEQELSEEFGFSDIKYFPKIYWVLLALYTLGANVFFQFVNIMTDLMIIRYKFTYEQGTQMVAYIFFLPIFVMPPLSMVVIKYGKKDLWILVMSILSLAANFLLLFSPIAKSSLVYVAVAMISLSFSIYSSVVFSSIALVIPSKGISIAFGVAFSVDNLLFFVLPFIFGERVKGLTPEDYNSSLKILMGMSTLCLFFSALLVMIDRKNGRLLNLPENDQFVLDNKRSLDWKFDLAKRNEGKEAREESTLLEKPQKDDKPQSWHAALAYEYELF